MTEETESSRRRTTGESPRRHSFGHGETKERKERRRRQSGDIEGMKEREDYMGYREQRESRRQGDDARGESRRHRDKDERGHRRHSKKRSNEGSQFQDVSSNSKEQYFEDFFHHTNNVKLPTKLQNMKFIFHGSVFP